MVEIEIYLIQWFGDQCVVVEEYEGLIWWQQCQCFDFVVIGIGVVEMLCGEGQYFGVIVGQQGVVVVIKLCFGVLLCFGFVWFGDDQVVFLIGGIVLQVGGEQYCFGGQMVLLCDDQDIEWDCVVGCGF